MKVKDLKAGDLIVVEFPHSTSKSRQSKYSPSLIAVATKMPNGSNVVSLTTNVSLMDVEDVVIFSMSSPSQKSQLPNTQHRLMEIASFGRFLFVEFETDSVL